METYESMWTPHMWLLNIQLKNFGHSYSQMSCNLRKHQQIDHAKQTNTQTKTKKNGEKNDVNRKKMLQKKKKKARYHQLTQWMSNLLQSSEENLLK